MAIIKKSPEQIDQMAAAGEVLVKTMSLIQAKIRPGVTTLELDQAAEKFIRSQGCDRPSRGTAAFRARSAHRPTRWSSTASRASTSSSGGTSSR